MEELMEVYDMPDARDTLQMMGIRKNDLQGIFQLLDMDKSGDLDYSEFMDAFVASHTQDLRTYLMMTKLQCDSMAVCIKRLDADMRT
eukprot:16306357-Heterocapsa_arctica.AAC.1